MTYNAEFLKKSIDLSRTNMSKNMGGPFGAVITKDGKVIAEGSNQVTSTNDPTAHAEMVAIRNACKTLNTFDLAGCEIYSSCEPCPMCLSAIYWARLDKIYFANSRQDAADIGFDDDFIYQEIPKPLESRKLACVHVSSPEANAVFKEWMKKVDKIEY
ncbi:MAG: nucleoside deaminase [Bdellovibrio sp.]|nr:nucleoside deaminase [Bdellovibrio sp.]